MMTKPGITELDRCVDSRYTLVSMVAKRARMIGTERKTAEEESEKPYNPKMDKAVTQAVNEISNGVVGYVRSEAIEKAKEYEEEKFEAISMLEKGISDTAKTDETESGEAESDNGEAESDNGEAEAENAVAEAENAVAEADDGTAETDAAAAEEEAAV